MTTTAIALFDFDGTVTSRDSLWCFLQASLSKTALYAGLFRASPYLLLYVLRLMPNDVAKSHLFRILFRNITPEQFDQLASQYAGQELNNIVRDSALEKIRWHQQQQHRVVLVSASPENWLRPWCEKLGIELISTRLEVVDSAITGRFLPANCYGAEKVRRIREVYALDQYDEIYAYGDSRGDREMLDIADHPHYRVFS